MDVLRPTANSPITVTFGIILLVLLLARPAGAATATASFSVTMTITASCTILSTNSLNFGSQGLLTTPINTTATFNVQCANTVPYNVGLDAGTTAGGTTITRLMSDGAGGTVRYTMYQDAAHTVNWGNTVGTDTKTGTGNGASQTLTVFGQVPAQGTPHPASYNDTVTITVTY
jgi:spore coat protein U-like protein